MKIYYITLLLIILLNCNFQEQCYASKGYRNMDGCAALLYGDSMPDKDGRTNVALDKILVICLYNYEILEECKGESRYWPLPKELE